MFFCYSLVGETFRKVNVKLMKSNNFGWQTNRRPKEPVLPAGHTPTSHRPLSFSCLAEVAHLKKTKINTIILQIRQINGSFNA